MSTPINCKNDALAFLASRISSFHHQSKRARLADTSIEFDKMFRYLEKEDQIAEGRAAAKFFYCSGWLTNQEHLSWVEAFRQLEQELGNLDGGYPRTQIVIKEKARTA